VNKICRKIISPWRFL